MLEIDRVCGLKGPSTGRQTASWKSDPLTVLGAQESCVHGEAAEQVDKLIQGNIAYTQK
jgi:hypothetical protein